MKYKPIIGIETHIELKTKSKMFCGCDANHFRLKPNTHTCPVCLGLPGALPVPNEKAIKWCLLVGLALNCKIPLQSKFDRKNYFYPDLPKGYQISQYDAPFCKKGHLNILINNKEKKIGITRVHMEEDTGKLLHKIINNEKCTLIDFNRSGVALMEVVSDPEIYSDEQAVSYLKKLQQIVRYLSASDCDMEKGSMRCEVNISLTSQKLQTTNYKLKTKELPNYKVEIKNINSFRFVKKAIQYEIERQSKILDSGKTPIQETRGFDSKTGKTFSQRVKETAHDYRYFPEPDIPPIKWKQKEIDQLKRSLPELPDIKIKRFKKQYNLDLFKTELLTKTKKLADYFEEVVKKGLDSEQAANLIINKPELLKFSSKDFVSKINKKKKEEISDQNELIKIIQGIIKKNPKPVNDYIVGKEQALQYLVGQAMKATKGRAHPKILKTLFYKQLKN
ncbi:MAG: Asp-tRNA(Asn)/Glu-tRNA(Gln) amidotransferase subunit GatB [Candidatus Pacebacteria bacterium]|nr:Asp-tRNA(Asn)/Glu-tRNA(Gln) amidotransferase subunit GatB [Candidatus Paceibacterota bacterium]